MMSRHHFVAHRIDGQFDMTSRPFVDTDSARHHRSSGCICIPIPVAIPLTIAGAVIGSIEVIVHREPYG